MKLTHYHQPTANSCGHTATAILLSGFGMTKTPHEVIDKVNVHTRPGTNEVWGSLLTDHGIYLISLGFKTTVYSFDVWVTDMSWHGKDSEFILKRLDAIKNKLAVPSLTKEGTSIYIDGYKAFLEAGGELIIQQHPTLELLKNIAQSRPFVASVNYQCLYGTAKIRFLPDGINTTIDDSGIPTNHSVVISDYRDGRFEVYDPWNNEKILWVSEQTLLSAIMAAQLECDNQLLVIEKG